MELWICLESKMAIDVKPILQVGVAAQAIGLAGENIKFVKKKKKKTKDLLGLGITNIAGVSLLKAQSQIIGDL
jgi:hypothetical protein